MDIKSFIDELTKPKEAVITDQMSEFRQEMEIAKAKREAEKADKIKLAFSDYYLNKLEEMEEEEKTFFLNMRSKQQTYHLAVTKLKGLQVAKKYGEETGNLFPYLKFLGNYYPDKSKEEIEKLKNLLQLDGDLPENVYEIPREYLEKEFQV